MSSRERESGVLGPTDRQVRQIDDEIRRIDERLYERAKVERAWNIHQLEAQRRVIGAPTTGALLEKRDALEAERRELLADREDFSREVA